MRSLDLPNPPAFVYKKRANRGNILWPQEAQDMVQRRLHGQRIAQRCAEMNLTLDGFKAEVGLDRRTIERLLSGKSQNARPQTVNVIAQFLGLAPRDILLLPNADVVPPALAPSTRPAVAVRLPGAGATL